jgi:hypothetical protein
MRPLPGPHRTVRAASLSPRVTASAHPTLDVRLAAKLPQRLSSRLALAGLALLLPRFRPMRREPICRLAR